MRKTLSIDEAFRSNFEVRGDDACWEWTGADDNRGYGQFRGKKAHRISYELTHGVTLHPTTLVCHRCDNRMCVNPAHMFLGSNRDNIKDCAAKGRNYTGGRRFTEVTVRSIHLAFRSGNVTKDELAREFGMSRQMVQHVLRGSRWRSVYEEFYGPKNPAPAAVAA